MTRRRAVAAAIASGLAAVAAMVVAGSGGDRTERARCDGPDAAATASCEETEIELPLPRVPWEGGPSYWARFPVARTAGWDDPAFFPIAVYFGRPRDAAFLRDLGINTYMNVEHDGSTMASVTGAGMYVIAQDEWPAEEIDGDGRVVGLFTCDEPDMGFCGGTDEAAGLDAFRRVVESRRSEDDGRFVFANFGNGVLRTNWMPTLMPQMVREVDAASVDKYAYTSPHVQHLIRQSADFPAGTAPDRSATYGWLAEQMRRFQDPAERQPTWVFVETAQPLLIEAGARPIRAEELEGAVWSALIHEARGIAYFQHSNDPACPAHHSLVDCPGPRRDAVRRVNARIRTLAPVLNTQSYAYDFANGTDTMLKAHDGAVYVFAGIGLDDEPGRKTFTLPPGVDGTSATVVGEDRTIPVTGRSFADDFAAEYSAHVYRIEL